jgi:hypothetical protein
MPTLCVASSRGGGGGSLVRSRSNSNTRSRAAGRAGSGLTGWSAVRLRRRPSPSANASLLSSAVLAPPACAPPRPPRSPGEGLTPDMSDTASGAPAPADTAPSAVSTPLLAVACLPVDYRCDHLLDLVLQQPLLLLIHPFLGHRGLREARPRHRPLYYSRSRSVRCHPNTSQYGVCLY